MATNTLKTRIKHSYKTESDWTSLNPVLLAGEVAYSSDKNGMYKIGDGSSTWSELPYNKSNTANNASSADKLTTARTIRTNLASTSTASFDGSANITPGVTGTLSIANGGTGQTTGINAANALIGSLGAGDTAPTDNTNIIVQGVGNYSDKFYRKPASLLWNYIKSKLATVATSGSYTDLTNKPTIPSVGNGTITITQNGSTKGTFTTNQSGNTTIALTDNNTTYSTMTGATSSASGSTGLVPAPASGNQAKFLRGDGTWATPTDTNTWRGIQNNLTSDSTTDSLSAAQGKALKTLVDGKANINHLHSYLSINGGTMTGSIITPKNNNMGIIPETDNYGQIGSSAKKFYRMYASTFYGNLNGTSATVSNNVKIGSATMTYDSTKQALVISFS